MGVKTSAKGKRKICSRQRMEAGELPAEEVVEAMMLAICGVLLVTPGFATDILGFLGLVPPLHDTGPRALTDHLNATAVLDALAAIP